MHDRNVTQHNQTVYEQLKNKTELDLDKSTILQQIKQELTTSQLSSNKKTNAQKIIDRMSQASFNSNLNDYEDNILSRVWIRVNSPENQANQQSLKQALFENLADGIEHGNEVCSTGRCARVLQTLTLLDSDTNLNKPTQTVDMIRSETFAAASKILQDNLPSPDHDYENDNTLKTKVNQQIREVVDKYDLDEKTKDNIYQEAISY